MRHQRNQCQKPLAGTMATARPSPTPPGPPERADLAPSGPPLLWLHWSWNSGGGGAGGSHSRGRPRPPLRQSLRWLRVGPGGSRGEPAAACTSAVCILRRRPSSPTRGSHLSLRRSRSQADPAAAAATAGQSPSPGAAQPPSAKQPPPGRLKAQFRPRTSDRRPQRRLPGAPAAERRRTHPRDTPRRPRESGGSCLRHPRSLHTVYAATGPRTCRWRTPRPETQDGRDRVTDRVRIPEASRRERAVGRTWRGSEGGRERDSGVVC